MIQWRGFLRFHEARHIKVLGRQNRPEIFRKVCFLSLEIRASDRKKMIESTLGQGQFCRSDNVKMAQKIFEIWVSEVVNLTNFYRRMLFFSWSIVVAKISNSSLKEVNFLSLLNSAFGKIETLLLTFLVCKTDIFLSWKSEKSDDSLNESWENLDCMRSPFCFKKRPLH